MRRLKTIHLISYFFTGGAERFIVDLISFSDKAIFENVVLVCGKTGSIFERELEEKGVAIYSLDLPPKRYADHNKLRRYLYYLLIVVPRMRRFLRNLKPDILHSHLDIQKIALPASLFLRIPAKVHTIHNVAEKDAPGLTRFFNKLAFRFFGVVPVSISREVSETIRKVYGRKLFVPLIHNGIDTQRFTSLGPKRIKSADEKIILINIARFESQKNHKLLIEAFEGALLEQPNMELWLVGDGSLRQEIELLVQKKGLSEKVKFLGVRSDIPQLLHQADIFVLSSDYEGLPLALLEAMAAGVPVIATAVGGVPEVLEDGKYGVLVPPGDTEALARAIVELARDEKKRAELSEQGRKSVVERFDIRNTVKEYEKLYLSLLEKKKKSKR